MDVFSGECQLPCVFPYAVISFLSYFISTASSSSLLSIQKVMSRKNIFFIFHIFRVLVLVEIKYKMMVMCLCKSMYVCVF